MKLIMSVIDYNHHYSNCVGWMQRTGIHQGPDLVLWGEMSGHGIIQGAVFDPKLNRWTPYKTSAESLEYIDYRWPSMGYLTIARSLYLQRAQRNPNNKTYLLGANAAHIGIKCVSTRLDVAVHELARSNYETSEVGIPDTISTSLTGQSELFMGRRSTLAENIFTSPEIIRQLFYPTYAHLDQATKAMETLPALGFVVLNKDFCLHRLLCTGQTIHLVYKYALIGTVSVRSGTILYADCAYLIDLVGRDLYVNATIMDRPRMGAA